LALSKKFWEIFYFYDLTALPLLYTNKISGTFLATSLKKNKNTGRFGLYGCFSYVFNFSEVQQGISRICSRTGAPFEMPCSIVQQSAKPQEVLTGADALNPSQVVLCLAGFHFALFRLYRL